MPRTEETKPTSFSSSNYQVLADYFRKGFKRCPVLFHQLKDHMQWDQWHTPLKATSRAQKVDKVLDINYNPHHQENINLFDEQKKFACSVFERTILTDQGRHIVRHNENYYDAQVVHKDFLKNRTKSVKYSSTTSSQLSCLTIARIDECEGADESFILH